MNIPRALTLLIRPYGFGAHVNRSEQRPVGGMSVHHIFASHLMRLMGWTDRSTLDLYGEDLQVEPATETKRRRGSLIPAGQVP